MVSRPRPVLPPVTRTTLEFKGGMSVAGEKGMVAMRWAVAKIVVLKTKVIGQVTVNSSFFFYIYLLSPYSITATWHCVVLGTFRRDY